MSAPEVRGWCPSLHEPMTAADGMIVRVKPYVRGLSAPDLRLIAEAAETYGSGRVELTSRGALQVRGLDPTGAAAFARTMVEAGLANADAAVERRRNLQLEPACGPALLALAKATEAWLEQDVTLAALPAKFGFGFSPEGGIEADIVVLGDDARTVMAGGAVAALASQTPLDAMQRLTHAFLALAAGLPRPPRRMKALVDAIGVEAVLAKAGLVATPPPSSQRDWPSVGPMQDRFGLSAAFGELSPEKLRAVADMVERFGGSRVELSPGRSIWLRGVASGSHAALAAQGMGAGLIVRADDPRLKLHACVGRSGCANAQDDVRADALRLASLAPVGRLHVSGCAKGCAHPGPAAVTLVSRGGAGRYDLILDGAVAQSPTHKDLTLDQIADAYRMTDTPIDYIRDGAAIYQRSFAIIRAEADLARFTPAEARVVVRMIHACGLVELAQEVSMSPDFEAAASAALRAGRPILCDSEMVAHGVTRARLPAQNPVICTLRDPQTPELALALGNTRSAAALDLWGERLGGAVVAIGNAPTALFHLLELIDAGAPRPAAVIGLPVGFVGAAESKAALAARGDLPFLVVHGRKGGSAMAAAAVNALASEVE